MRRSPTYQRPIRLRLAHAAVVPFAAGLGILASVPFTLKLAKAVQPAGRETMPVSEIKAGMRGYGLTVFRGTEPERFDIEVVGTVHNFRPHQDLVLVRTFHPRLEAAKVVKGMSGSPVFIQDKMIGAYAYGWQFGSEPIVGVTPIRSMLDEMARPVPALQPLPAPATPLQSRREALRMEPREGTGIRYAGGPGDYDLRGHARQLAAIAGGGSTADSTAASNLTQVATPVLLGGMTDRAAKLAQELLSPLGLEAVQGGGAGNTDAADAPTRYTDGGAIGVQMISGDISAMGLGTVTRVEGSRLVAFGHPMMNAGVSSMPTSIGRVVWVLASQSSSFKIGEAVRPLGALVNDRQAAIVVDANGAAPRFPVTFDIEGVDGAPHRTWSFSVAHEKFMAPAFLATAVGNAIEATTSERRDVTWRASTQIKIAGYAPLTVEDVGVSIGGTPDSDEWAHSRAVQALGALLNNPWEPVRIEGITSKMSVRFARDIYRLRGVQALADDVEAGHDVRIRLDLEPFAGPIEHKLIDVSIPRELAGKDVEIDLSPGYKESPELPAPERVTDLLANLPRQTYPAETLVASIRLGEHGVAMHGQVAERLPRGALDILRPAHDTASPEPFVSYARTAYPMKRFVEGHDCVKVHVRGRR